MLLHVHKERTDRLCLKTAANEDSQHRENMTYMKINKLAGRRGTKISVGTMRMIATKGLTTKKFACYGLELCI